LYVLTLVFKIIELVEFI